MKITLEQYGRIMASSEDTEAITGVEVTELFYRAMLGIGFQRETVVDALESIADEHHEDSEGGYHG